MKTGDNQYAVSHIGLANSMRRHYQKPPMEWQTPPKTPTAHAVVNQGRWIVRCPFCAGAELMWEDKEFMCLSCFNEKAEGKPLKVIIPRNRKAIEAILEKRPLENQNWEVGETIDNLLKENAENGVN